MKAVVLPETGGALEYRDVPDPVPAEGQALVRVRAAGVNFADVLIRQGRYPQAPELPAVLGIEVSGEADGRRVMALAPVGGGYAELLAVGADRLVPMPEHASWEEGAAFLMAFLTAYLPLTRLARVGPGTTVLVHSASGGVGLAAVQVARHLGARVVATASTAEKRERVLAEGAHEAYGYEEFADRVRADVVFDLMGGDVFAASIPVVRPLGLVLAVGYAGGLWKDVSPTLLVGRNVGVQGFYLGRLIQHRPEIVRAAALELVELWRDGVVRPVVGARYPLAEAGEALRLIEERRHVGKVVLLP